IGNHLQIFVSAVVILGAAAVALICDLLKRNNEDLRALNVELRIRREEEQRRHELILQTVAAAPVPLSLPAPAPVESMAVAISETASAPLAPSRRGRRQEPEVAEAPAADIAAGASLAEARMLAREFMGRAAERARGASKETSNSAAPVVR